MSLGAPLYRSRRTKRAWKSKAATVEVAVENFFRISKPTDWRLAGRPSSVVSNWHMISLRKPRFSVHDGAGFSCGGAGAAGRSAKGSDCGWPARPAAIKRSKSTARLMTLLLSGLEDGDGSRAGAGEWTEGWRQARAPRPDRRFAPRPAWQDRPYRAARRRCRAAVDRRGPAAWERRADGRGRHRTPSRRTAWGSRG